MEAPRANPHRRGGRRSQVNTSTTFCEGCRKVIGRVCNGTVSIYVLDDMGTPSETSDKRVAIEMTGKRMGLNRDQLIQHIEHCLAALERF